MRSFILCGAVALGLGVTAGSLWGDIPGPWSRTPPPIPSVPQMAALPPPNAAQITVEVSQTVLHPTLTIPGPLLERVQRREEKARVGSALPSLDHLLFAAVLLGGGLYLVRGRARLAFAIATLLLIGVTVGSMRSALASPPPTPRQVRLGDVLLDDVKIVVTKEWGDLKLVLPAGEVERWNRRAK